MGEITVWGTEVGDVRTGCRRRRTRRSGSDLRGLVAKAVKCRTGSVDGWSDRPSVSTLFDDFQRIGWTAGRLDGGCEGVELSASRAASS
jgi:hypothetical protein